MIHVDIETRARVDLRKSNVYRYVEDPDFRILMMAWAKDDGPISLTTDEEEIRSLVREWWDSGEIFVAHNAAFERVCFSALLGEDHLDPSRWIDPAVWAVEAGLPRSLDKLSKALKVEQKDSAGAALINWFSKPDRSKEFRSPEQHPEKWQQFCDYCVTDVEVMRQCLRKLPAPTESETELWVVSERINDRGIPVDLELSRAAVAAGEENTRRGKERVSELLGIENPNSVIQLKDGLVAIGLEVPNLTAETVSNLLLTELTDVQREVLEQRQELALSAAKKFQAALNGAGADGRIRGAFKFYGASTGRYSGSGAQPQNLPRAAISASPVDVVDRALADDIEVGEAAVLEDAASVQREIDSLLRTGSSSPHTLKALVRSMFLGPMTVCDYSSIEARVLAWLAREKWALDAFRDGQDIYSETAAKMGPGFTRQEGKAAVLGLGYNGSVNALRNIGMEGPDEELLPLVVTWRQANQRIVSYWSELWDAWVSGGTAGKVTVAKGNGVRRMVLPTGAAITYRGVRYETYFIEDDEGRKIRKEGWRYDRPEGGRVRVWPGIIIENLTQRVARDLLAHALVELDREGLPVIAHVHDEVLVEGSYGVEDVAEIMCRAPEWAVGLPIDADGFTAPERYRKG